MLTVKCGIGHNYPMPSQRRPARLHGDNMPHNAIESWLVTFPSASTQAAYRRDLTLFLGWLDERGLQVFGVTEKVFGQYRDTAGLGVTPSTHLRRLASVSSFYRYAVEQNHVNSSPAGAPRNVALPSRSLTARLSKGEIASVWEASSESANRRIQDPRAAVIVGLLLFDGMKLFEILALDVPHVRGTTSSMSVRTNRSGRPEVIDIDQRTSPWISRLCRGRSTGPLLLGQSATVGGDRLTRFGADYLLKSVGARAGIATPLTANRLRATHISKALATMADHDAARESVGHLDRRTTLRFLSEG
jgi:integrase/recombinase XerD